MVCPGHPSCPLLNITLHQFQIFEAGKEVYRYSQTIGNQLSEMHMLLADMKAKQHVALSMAAASTAKTLLPTRPASSAIATITSRWISR